MLAPYQHAWFRDHNVIIILYHICSFLNKKGTLMCCLAYAARFFKNRFNKRTNHLINSISLISSLISDLKEYIYVGYFRPVIFQGRSI